MVAIETTTWPKLCKKKSSAKFETLSLRGKMGFHPHLVNSEPQEVRGSTMLLSRIPWPRAVTQAHRCSH